MFKKNNLNYKVVKIKVYNNVYKNISDSKEDQDTSFKEAQNPTLIFKDISNPDVYYSDSLHTLYRTLKAENLNEFNEFKHIVYNKKSLDKALTDADTGVLVDCDNEDELFDTGEHYRMVKLKCVNNVRHKIKKIKLDRIIDAINDKTKLCPVCSRGDNYKQNQVSNQERWFYDILKSEIDNSKFKNKVSVSDLDSKEELDTQYQSKNQNQDIDVLIKFPKEIDYKGKKIKGIGIACNGPFYHSYEANKGKQSSKINNYSNTNINDTLRYNSENYLILNWDEGKTSDEKRVKSSAESFINNRVFPILRTVFEGNREIYDQNTYSRQMQQQRLGEIAQALNDKCKNFEYENVKISNLGKYFLSNKKELAYDKDGKYDKEKVRVWAGPLSDGFSLDNTWKKKIQELVLHNEDRLKANKISKGTVDYINKNNRDTNLDLKQYDKVRERRQFAKLFEEIKRRASK